MKLFKKASELIRYRDLLVNLVLTELKLRYRRSVLGFLWTMLNPLLMMAVLAVVFSTVMRFEVKHYAVLLLAGLLPWQFFSQSINLSLMSIIGKGALLRKVYIPKAVIPLAAVFASLINFLLALVPLLLVAALVGHDLHPALTFLPVSVVILTLFTCGLSFLFSCLNVFFRDFSHMTDVLLQAWFYASPVIYTPAMLPEKFRPFFMANPMLYIIDCFRLPIFDGQLPSGETVLLATASAVVAFALGYMVFLRYERLFVLRV